MKLFILILAVSVMVQGCSNDTPIWRMESHLVTQYERDCAVKMQKDMIGKYITTLSGDDQDLEDTIEAAKVSAVEICAQPRMFEYENIHSANPTGRYRELTPDELYNTIVNR